MTAIPAHLRRMVFRRASGCCEYCRLAQAGQEAAFHVDHIIPIAAGGTTESSNLALSCVSCSLRKAARRTAIDPLTGQMAPLYHPRVDAWPEHFEWDGVILLGRTATGRATVAALDMNRSMIVEIRREEVLLGRHP